MADLKLTLACWNYDRTRALMDGSVRPQGIELTYLNLFVAEAFQRMMRDRATYAASGERRHGRGWRQAPAGR